MIAKNLAAALKSMGVEITEIREGTAEADGFIKIADTVHVKVPTYGNAVQIVKYHNGEFVEWKPTRDLIIMAAQIEEALE